MCNVNQIYNMLRYEQPIEIQQEGVRLAEKIEDLSLLIQPPAPAAVWEHCANILYEKDDFLLEPYLEGLFGWLYDLNWPGAYKIYERLALYPKNIITSRLVNFINKTVDTDNFDGIRWIFNLHSLLDEETLKKEIKKELLKKMEAYMNDDVVECGEKVSHNL